MMMFTTCVPSHLHRAVHIVLITALDFDLDCRVGNPEMVIQFSINSAQNLFTAADTLFRNHNVATATIHAGADRPNMEIVYG